MTIKVYTYTLMYRSSFLEDTKLTFVNNPSKQTIQFNPTNKQLKQMLVPEKNDLSHIYKCKFF